DGFGRGVPGRPVAPEHLVGAAAEDDRAPGREQRELTAVGWLDAGVGRLDEAQTAVALGREPVDRDELLDGDHRCTSSASSSSNASTQPSCTLSSRPRSSSRPYRWNVIAQRPPGSSRRSTVMTYASSTSASGSAHEKRSRSGSRTSMNSPPVGYSRPSGATMR